MSPELRFRECYRHLPDDELARCALEDELVPEARQPLAEELHHRGLTDLSAYKSRLDQDAAQSSSGTDREAMAPAEDPMDAYFFAWLASVLALVGPVLLVTLAAPDSDMVELAVVTAALIGFSGYLGVRARRQGSRKGHRLMLVLPLVLLGLSTMAAVLLVVMKVHM